MGAPPSTSASAARPSSSHYIESNHKYYDAMPRKHYRDVVHDAYTRLTPDQLSLFALIRGLPTNGSPHELAARLAHHDLHTYAFPTPAHPPTPPPESDSESQQNIAVDVDIRPPPTLTHAQARASSTLPSPVQLPERPHSSPPTDAARIHARALSAPAPRPPASSAPSSRKPRAQLPVEIMADILDTVGDWELSKAVGLPTALPPPLAWARANGTDHALLTGYLPLLISADPDAHPPTAVGATLTVRFGYTHILAYLFRAHRPVFTRMFKSDLIPLTAMAHGRIQVLEWWLSRVSSGELQPVKNEKAAEALENASRAGQARALEWWRVKGLPLICSEAALEAASARNALGVLDWWAEQARAGRIVLKVGRVMDTASSAGAVGALDWWARSGLDFTYDRAALAHASCQGRVDVLEWWAHSGMQLFFDGDALVGATRHDRPEVLQWWAESGLGITYRLCDIEEALEDAIGGGERAREWWRRKGVDFDAGDAEWMKVCSLN
ncbi:unnamed protein product [Peniophora sp. CBMAI 1063]|nr:unnamed protein product [Peniophora sp. CBMAI 1063]